MFLVVILSQLFGSLRIYISEKLELVQFEDTP